MRHPGHASIPRPRFGALAVVSTLSMSLALGSPVAHADAIGLSSACPPGSYGDARHAGSWCVAAACTDACGAEGASERCETRRVCTETRSVFAGSPAAAGLFGDPGNEDVEMVVEICAADASCDGTGDRAPTAGTLREGSRGCALRSVCVPDALPPFASRLDRSPVPEARAAEATPSAASPEPAAGCGCGAARSTDGSAVLALPLLAIAAWSARRRRR